MIQDENVKCWVNCWKSSIDESEFITDEMQAVRWNKRADQFGNDVDEERKQKKNAELFELLNKAGFSPSGAQVLDIGCGPGSLSIPLARAGAKVTSLDISSGMLYRLKETAEREGLQIFPMECSWWSADIDKLGFRNKFDLVIASMTPAIKNVETFDLMMACSRKYCYYSNFIRKFPDKIPNDIYVRILETAPNKNVFAAGLLFPFMYLYTQGFYPIIKFDCKSEHLEENWFEAAEKAIGFLQFSQDLPEEKKEKIREYYKNMATDGMIISDNKKYMGMMVWSVNKQ